MKRKREVSRRQPKIKLLDLPVDMIIHGIGPALDLVTRWMLGATCTTLRQSLPITDDERHYEKYYKTILQSAPLRFANMYVSRKWPCMGGSGSNNAYYYSRWAPAYAQNPAHTSIKTILPFASRSDNWQPYSLLLKGLLESYRDNLIHEWEEQSEEWDKLKHECHTTGNWLFGDMYRTCLERDDYLDLYCNHTLVPCITRRFLARHDSAFTNYALIAPNEKIAMRCFQLAAANIHIKPFIPSSNEAEKWKEASLWGFFLLCKWFPGSMAAPSLSALTTELLRDNVKRAIQYRMVNWLRAMFPLLGNAMKNGVDVFLALQYASSSITIEQTLSLEETWTFLVEHDWLSFQELSMKSKCHFVGELAKHMTRQELVQVRQWMCRDVGRVPHGDRMIRVFDLFLEE